jgi:D-alanyl-D-alanine carboxypeptidase/D-alanyl-D-alanine-endopeptidase (penicillin-binding protein 4)
MVSRRWVLSGLIASAAGPGCAEAPSKSLRPPARPMAEVSLSQAQSKPGAEAIVAAAKLGGTVGFVLAETASGKVLEAMNPKAELPPASVAKSLTAFYALERLGAQHRFATRVMATGPVSAGRLQGDLILVGTGDPTLDTDGLGALAANLAARGITEISGRYLAYGGGFPNLPLIDRDQPDHVGYNPAISGLNLNFNRVNFEWKRSAKGYELGMDARGGRFFPRVAMARIKAVDRDAPLFTFKNGQDLDEWTVSARALGNGGSRWLPVRHPEFYTAEVFATLMRAHGLTLPPVKLITALPAAVTLAERRSEPLGDVMRDMLRFSTNITAEVIGLTASGAGTLRDSAGSMSDWAEARHSASMRFVDHSGLGGASRIAAAEMVQALRAARDTAMPNLLREQGVRDENGQQIKNHPVRIHAKTGTLNFVSGLAGYIRPPQGPELTFAIFSADTPRRDRLAKQEREQPEGGRQWTRRARKLQAQLITRWAGLYT